jgi:metal-dependent amidase/aminoacylase/carboxypeptidase family protein
VLDELAGRPGAFLLVFGAVHAGDAANVIPSHGVLRGTLRTLDIELWRSAPELMEKAVARVLSAGDAVWSLDHRRGVPPVVNDQRMTGMLDRGRAGGAGTRRGGRHRAVVRRRLVRVVPRAGAGVLRAARRARPRSSRPRLDLHASTFDVDERAIGIGALVLATVALDALDALTHPGR